ncbi:phosphoribosyl transferase domain protein [Boeremia exigua]|uniref:phosphoribosyl transferase domain protein n=1 Tax=Boeremia exigua TaxID=749465 RepID=UPI001E8EAEE5|nr:phosphoribosyl transferase domain protein [Boeremia exigua]KAH6613026.1 phosphoribosyl transferase domain protein [Boeremia exigua]
MIDVKRSHVGETTTLQDLKGALRVGTSSTTASSKQALSDTQYSIGFDILLQGSTAYEHFIFPQLTRLLAPLLDSRDRISVLEIGPGPKSVLGCLPDYQKRKIRRYEAFEQNQMSARSLEEWLSVDAKTRSRFPCLEDPPTIHRLPFDPQQSTCNGRNGDVHDADGRYDVILFCHSMYGMPSKGNVIKQSLELLTETRGGVLAIFHRGESLHLDGLVCHQTASFPTGVVRIANEDQVLDNFAPLIAGFVMHEKETYKIVQGEWRKVCRNLGFQEESYPDQLLFSSPEVMVAFTRDATELSTLTTPLPTLREDRRIKNQQARLHHPAAISRPTEIDHIQHYVRWALEHGTGLTVIGGSHSGHCIWNNIVSIDMGAFCRVYIHRTEQDSVPTDVGCETLVVAEAGCTTGDIITKAMAAGVTVPLGSRPSVGAGLWLQGGIGHLARMHGLACDTIVGAIMVSVESGEVLCVGYVPSRYRPATCIRPKNETDILWALKGAGTNFGIIVSVTFRTHPAPTYQVQTWAVPLSSRIEAQHKLSSLDTEVASKLSRDCSADVYLYWDDDRLHLGVTMIVFTTTMPTAAKCSFSAAISSVLGAEESSVKSVDGVGLFDTEMYVSKMHGGHGGGKTSSFKRCLFLKGIGDWKVAERLVAAVEGRPSALCYLHLLQGGGATSDIAANANAFGCRDWDFACVITGVWPRDQDGTEVARAAVKWVYGVAEHLLPISKGVYSADLGPDPRDAVLAHRAFGPNRQRLAQLKYQLDPQNVLAYTCPLPKAPLGPKLILLITGQSGVGKDYCANAWVSMFAKRSLSSRAVSISEAIKREYAAATGADASRLLSERAYKEQHRTSLTAYFLDRVQHEPQLPEEQFLQVVNEAADVGVLLITGMRDNTPVAAFSHLAPNSRLIEVYVHASAGAQRSLKDRHAVESGGASHKSSILVEPSLNALSHQPCLTFDNKTAGDEAANKYFEDCLLPLVHEDLLRLTDMVRSIPNFPRQNIVFRHVIGISQQPGGLALCTSLLQRLFPGDWSTVTAIACCEVGGIVFASPLSLHVNVPLILVREAGKLPPPTFSAVQSRSHISSLISNESYQKRVEIGRNAVPKGGPIVVVDDTLATGETLCAVLQALKVADAIKDVTVLVVAEFPIHRGRELLCKRGFAHVKVRSLLSFNGA